MAGLWLPRRKFLLRSMQPQDVKPKAKVPRPGEAILGSAGGSLLQIRMRKPHFEAADLAAVRPAVRCSSASKPLARPLNRFQIADDSPPTKRLAIEGRCEYISRGRFDEQARRSPKLSSAGSFCGCRSAHRTGTYAERHLAIRLSGGSGSVAYDGRRTGGSPSSRPLNARAVGTRFRMPRS